MRRWRKVSMDELREIWAKLREQKVLYNGMTDVTLRKKYGRENVKHILGKGWYKLTQI